MAIFCYTFSVNTLHNLAPCRAILYRSDPHLADPTQGCGSGHATAELRLNRFLERLNTFLNGRPLRVHHAGGENILTSITVSALVEHFPSVILKQNDQLGLIGNCADDVKGKTIDAFLNTENTENLTDLFLPSQRVLEYTLNDLAEVPGPIKTKAGVVNQGEAIALTWITMDYLFPSETGDYTVTLL